MKKHILFALLAKWKGLNSSWKKKLIIGAGLLSLFSLALLGVGIYLVIKVSGFFFDQAKLVIPDNLMSTQGPIVREKVIETCGSTLMQLMTPGLWLEAPLGQTFSRIKAACWTPLWSQPSCPAGECPREPSGPESDGTGSI